MICRFKKGFSLVEVMAVVAVLMVLAGMVLGLGKRLQDQAKEKLAQSTIDILVTAIEVYYADEGEFPFYTVALGAAADYVTAIGCSDLNLYKRQGNEFIATDTDILKELSAPFDWTGAALYFRLTRSVNSKKIINSMDDSVFSSNYANYNYVDSRFTDESGNPAGPFALIRFIDPWGNAYRYSYTAGNAFAMIDSAGADGEFDNGDDLSSK
jgi:prepilin-type N-terminal cleavage/methylation domain-containing protein